jgi:hypothetical protein
MYINTVKELIQAVRQGRFTSIGCYPLYFVTKDGGTLDPKTVKDNLLLVGRAVRDRNDPQWEVIGCDVNWENPDMYDDHTGDRIESAYAEDSSV